MNGSVLPDDWPPLVPELPEELLAPLVEPLPELELEPEEDEELEEDAGAELEPELPELCELELEPEVLEPLSGSTYCWSPAETPDPWASAVGTSAVSATIRTMQVQA